MVLLVMGRELVSFKIVDAELSIDVASPAAAAAALESADDNPSAVTIALVVEDMSLRDMQASVSDCQKARDLFSTGDVHRQIILEVIYRQMAVIIYDVAISTGCKSVHAFIVLYQTFLEVRLALQARPEHSMVLRPNAAADSCSLTLEYTHPVDPSLAPSLVIEMANPRMLLLFRQCSKFPR